MRALLTLAALAVLLLPAARADSPVKDDSWQRAIGAWPWQFPRDHGAHPAFKTEWWYFTGNLQDADKRPFGYQLTVFRQGIQFKPAQPDSKWAVRDFYFGHFTISDIRAGDFHVAERVSRGAFGDAKSAEGRMDVTLGPWSIRQAGDETMKLIASDANGTAIDFTARPAKPLVFEGVKGLSQKADGAGEASYYYSYPRLTTTGSLTAGGKTYTVSGLSWFDHEFSTSSLGPEQVGWDWFCLQLDNNQEVMLYAMRDKSGAMDPNSEGTWINADGTSERLPPGSFTIEKKGAWHSAKSGADYPAGWHVVITSRRAELTVTPSMEAQELQLSKMGALNYWEGACEISGRVGDASVKGSGYTELTGYAGSLQPGLTK